MIRYAFEANQGIGRNSLAPHAAHGNEDILAALTMGRGPFLCIFKGDDLQVVVRADRALVRFAFKTVYPRVTDQRAPKDARIMAKLGYRYWVAHDISEKQLEAARSLLVGKYEGKHRNHYIIAGERLCSPNPLEVGRSACIAAWWDSEGVQRADLTAYLKSNARRLLA